MPGTSEQREQLRAHRVDGLGLGEGGRRAGRGARAELQDRRERGVAQARVDHAGLLEQHQVAIRQLAQGRAIRDQQARGAALGEDQREHLPVRPRARARSPLRVAGGSREQRVHLGEVGAVPGPEPVAEPAQLAEARARGERDAVQVVEHDALARRRGVRPVEIRAQRRRADLAQLVGGCRRCSRPASGGTSRAASRACCRPAGSGPAARGASCERVAAARRSHSITGLRVGEPAASSSRFSTKSSVCDDQRRDAGEVPVDLRRVARVRQRAAGVVLDREAGAHLLVIDRRQSPVHQLAQALRRARLELHLEAGALEPRDEARQLGVAEALVVGSARRKPDRGAACPPRAGRRSRARCAWRAPPAGARCAARPARAPTASSTSSEPEGRPPQPQRRARHGPSGGGSGRRHGTRIHGSPARRALTRESDDRAWKVTGRGAGSPRRRRRAGSRAGNPGPGGGSSSDPAAARPAAFQPGPNSRSI